MNTRIDIGDLKSQIKKRVGPDRSQWYFGFLNRLLSQKLSKHEFDKLCVLTLGRENLPLHNQLIRAILKNACQAKAPPPKVIEKNLLSNGDVLQPCPKRSRSDHRKIKDYFPSPLGPNGRISELLSPHNEAVVWGNGDLGPCDLKRPVHHQEHVLAEQPVKRSRIAEESTMGLVKLADVDVEREDFEQRSNLKSAANVPIQAPLGIPFCHPSVGARRALTSTASAGFGNFIRSFETGELCHSDNLQRRMERIVESQGLGGVTVDCANLLNKGLDAYLKRLIGSCSELVGERSAHGQIKQPIFKQQAHGKPINGVWQGNHMHVQSSGLPFDGVHELMNRHPISLQDFRVAMELNPQQLGEDWPLLLEKICIRSFEE